MISRNLSVVAQFALLIAILPWGASYADPGDKDSIDRLPKGSKLVLKKDISIRAFFVHRYFEGSPSDEFDGDIKAWDIRNSWCRVHVHTPKEDLTLKRGTEMVFSGKSVPLAYGVRSKMALRVSEPQNVISVDCYVPNHNNAGHRSPTLAPTIGDLKRAFGGVADLQFPGTKQISKSDDLRRLAVTQ